MSRLEEVRGRLKNLILTTCNVVGCDACPYKWPKAEGGYDCSSNELMRQEHEEEEKEKRQDE